MNSPYNSWSPQGQPTQPPTRSAALLIDFDNVTLGAHGDLGRELQTLLNNEVFRGKIAVRRAYGDWRRYPNYVVPLTEANIDMIWAPSWGSSKKNTTDLRMAMDAMELCFTRPDMGTFILLTGDSDFSSCVMKLKEYGKYVIGVGMKESASDLIVKNCDEYYSYHALTGLSRANMGEGPTEDPWVLVGRAARMMTTRGDSMRVDRLKQVMIELDPGFDEKNAGFGKFSKFVQRAGERGLIRLRRDDAGQFEVIAVDEEGSGGGFASPVAPPRDRERERDRDRVRGRGRDRDRGRGRPDRPRFADAPAADAGAATDEPDLDFTVEVPRPAAAVEAPAVDRAAELDAAPLPPRAAPAAEAAPAAAPAGGRGRGRGRGGRAAAPGITPPLLPGQVLDLTEVAGAPAAPAETPAPAAETAVPAQVAEAAPAEAPAAPEAPREEAPAAEAAAPAPRAEAPAARGPMADPLRNAYSLLQHATRALVRGPGQAARDGDVKRRMLEMQADFDEAPLGFSKFSRFLRQAHEDNVVDLRQVAEGRYEVALPAGGGRLPAPVLTAAAEGAAPAVAAETAAAPEAAPAGGRGRGRGRGRGAAGAPPLLPGQVPGGDAAAEAPAARVEEAPAPEAPAPAPAAPAPAPTAPAEAAARGGARGRGRGGRGAPSGPPPLLPGQVIDVAGLATPAPQPEPAAPAAEAPAAQPAAAGFEFPTDRDGALAYLGAYKGVGRKTAEALVDTFGENVFRAMEEDPGAVRQLLGDRRSGTVLDQFAADPNRAQAPEAQPEAAHTDSPEPVADTPAADTPAADTPDADTTPVDASADEASAAAEPTGDEGGEEDARPARRSRGRRGGRGRGRAAGDEVTETAAPPETAAETPAALAEEVIGDTDPTLVAEAVTDPEPAPSGRARRGRGRGRARADEAQSPAALADEVVGDTDPTLLGTAVVTEDAPAADAPAAEAAPRRRGRGRARAAEAAPAAEAPAPAAEAPAPEAEAPAAPAAKRGRGRGRAAAGSPPPGEAPAPEAPAPVPPAPEGDAAARRGRRGGRGRGRARGGNGAPAE